MSTLSYDRIFIGGEWIDPAGPDRLEVISPVTEEAIGSVPLATTADVDRAVASARLAFDDGDWPHAAVTERSEVLRRFAGLYAGRLSEMANLITEETGIPITTSELVQASMPRVILSRMLKLAAMHPWEEHRPGMLGGDVLVCREPVGVVAAIVPWNAPQFIIMSKLAPALLAGCTVVLKPAPETPLDAFMMPDMLAEARLPPGVVSVVPGDAAVGEHLVRHPGVDKVTFTGSTAAGRHIAAACGQDLKRLSLELGGKSAAIILDDADLPATVANLELASLANSGQACALQTRILVSRQHYDEVVERVAAMVANLRVGDPHERDTEVGPLVSRRQRDRVESYIALGEQEGAKLVVGGSGPPAGLDRGWYVQPSVFANVDNGMRIAQEEIFGPVLAIIPFEDERDAIRLANESPYGLAGSVWTADIDRGVEVARRVRTGTFGVNQYLVDPIAPFGGFKASGLGRELGPEGLDAYVEFKSIMAPPRPPVA